MKVKTAIAKWKELNTDKHISERDIQTIISKLPKKKDDIMEQIKFLLLEAKALKTVVTNDDERKQLVNRLVDVTLKPDMILTNLMK